GLALGHDAKLLDRDIHSTDENTAVRVSNAHVPHPGIPRCADRDGVEPNLCEMSAVRRVCELERETLDSDLLDGASRRKEPRVPLEPDIGAERTVDRDELALDSHDARKKALARAVRKVVDRTSVVRVEMARERLLWRVALNEPHVVPDADALDARNLQ